MTEENLNYEGLDRSVSKHKTSISEYWILKIVIAILPVCAMKITGDQNKSQVWQINQVFFSSVQQINNIVVAAVADPGGAIGARQFGGGIFNYWATVRNE